MGMFTRRDILIKLLRQIETCLYSTFSTGVCQMGIFTRRNMCVYTEMFIYTFKAAAEQIETCLSSSFRNKCSLTAFLISQNRVNEGWQVAFCQRSILVFTHPPTLRLRSFIFLLKSNKFCWDTGFFWTDGDQKTHHCLCDCGSSLQLQLHWKQHLWRSKLSAGVKSLQIQIDRKRLFLP